MFVRDDDDANDFHFRLKKKTKKDDDTDDDRVDQRKQDDAPELDDLLNDADSTARAEGGEIEI